MEEKLITSEAKTSRGDGVLVYEASYILLPSLASEQVPAKAVAIKSMLTSVGGQVLTGEDPVLIDLAYPMLKIVSTVRHKVTTGYFGWVKFEISTDGIEKLKKALNADDLVIRYLIIRTVRENTLLNGKMNLAKEKDQKVKFVSDDAEDVTEEVVVNQEEIDKSIDDLVIV